MALPFLRIIFMIFVSPPLWPGTIWHREDFFSYPLNRSTGSSADLVPEKHKMLIDS